MNKYVAVLLVTTSAALSAQWLNHPDPRTPRALVFGARSEPAVALSHLV